jgi:hypothetical protein
VKYVAAFDIGTTAVKGVMVSERKQAVASYSQTIRTIYDNGRKEQDYDSFISSLFSRNCTVYRPDSGSTRILDEQYRKFTGVYPQVQPIFNKKEIYRDRI